MMSVDEAENLSNLLKKYSALAILISGDFKKFRFYVEKRFSGVALNSYIALLPSLECALAFAMVAERKGHDLLLLRLGEGAYTLLIAKCKSSRLIFSNLLVRVFKRGGVVIPRTASSSTPVAIFRREMWREFELYELPTIKEYCNDYAYVHVALVRRKDLMQISKLRIVIEKSKELREVLEKSGDNISEIIDKLLQINDM
jgi:hypothetical protein